MLFRSIISFEMYKTVQTVRAQFSKKWTESAVNPYTPNIFKGKIFCGHCDRHINRTRSHDVYKFYCLAVSRIAKDACKPVSVKEDDLIKTLLTLLRKEADVLLGKQKLIRQKDDSLLNKKAAVTASISALKQEIDINGRFLRGLYESLLSEIITQDEHFKMKSDYEAKITAAIKKQTALEDNQKQLEKQIDELSTLVDSMTILKTLTAELVEKTVEKIRIFENGEVDVTFRFQNDFNRIDEVVSDV